MKWTDFSPAWQACLDEAWQACLAGSIPIGSVILNEDKDVICRGRNHTRDNLAPAPQLNHHPLAHAELNALLQLNQNGRKVNPHTCSIYTTMEPCPLCMGAIYMSGVRQIMFASRDSYAGSTNLLGTTPYLSRKPVKVFGPENKQIEDVLIALVTEYYFRSQPNDIHLVLDPWKSISPNGVTFGERLFADGWFNSVSALKPGAAEIFEMLLDNF